MVPEITGGCRIHLGFQGGSDVGGFKFGTRFALNWGAGLRYVPGGGSRYQLRADLTNRLTSIRYPDAYFRAADQACTPIITATKTSRCGETIRRCHDRHLVLVLALAVARRRGTLTEGEPWRAISKILTTSMT